MKKAIVLLGLLILTIFHRSFGNGTSNKDAFFTRPWSVSNYGFLIFPSILDLDEFVQFAQTKTHTQMQQYIQDSLSGFTSIGASLYSTSGVTVTENEAYHYAMNTYRIVQASGVIIRPISERECSVNYEFVLTLTPAYLNSTTYDHLQSGTYDANSMNRFATNPDTESGTLVQFVSFTPYGHADTEPSDCPAGDFPVAKMGTDKIAGSTSFKSYFSESDPPFKYSGPCSYGYKEKHHSNNIIVARRFWGWGSESCVQDGTWFDPVSGQYVPRYSRCQSYYIFWINVNNDCYFAYGCQGPPMHGNAQ